MGRRSSRVNGSRTAYIGLGANLGDRLATLREAVRRLGDLGAVTGVSSLYETAPVGYVEQPSFLNAVVELQATLDAPSLVEALLVIEADLGRTRSFRNAPRTLDLDLLLLGDLVVVTNDAHVPHSRLHERSFVVTPLAELAPDATHPVMRRTTRELFNALESSDGVDLVDGPEWVNLPANDADIAEDRSGNPASD